MKTLQLHRDYRLAHAAEILEFNGEVRPLRFPQKVIDTMGDSMGRIATMNTGVELQIHGRVKTLTLNLRVMDGDGFGHSSELMIEHLHLLPRWILDFDPLRTQQQTFKIENEPSGNVLRFLFPTHMTLQVVKVEVNDDAVIFPLEQDWSHSTGSSQKTWVAHGDSITQGANVHSPSNTWVQQCAKELKLCPINLGIGGHGRGEPEVGKYLAGLKNIDLLSLHIGTNCINDKEPISKFSQRVTAFCKNILDSHYNIPVYLVSPVYRNLSGKDDQAFVQTYRDEMQNIHQSLSTHFPKFMYIDGMSLLDNDIGMMGDRLHLGDSASTKYAQRLSKILKIH